MKEIKTLVFSGSGSKIFMHLGFVKYLVENKLFSKVNTFVGTSGGSIVSLLLSINYDIETLTELFIKLKYEQLEKIDSDSILNFFDTYGVDTGENMERALRIMLKNKMGNTHLNFKELYELTNNSLVVCSTNLQRHQEVYFDYINYPELDIIDAVVMSISIPFIYTPRKYKGDLYVDGGLLSHYPIEYIENTDIKCDETLGILILPDYNICKNDICENETSRKIEIPTFESYILNVITCPTIKQIKHVYEKYKNNTVLAINNNSGLNFNVSTELKTKYIYEAYEYTKKYFEDNQKLEDDKEIPEENNSSEEEDNSEKQQNSSDDEITISDTIVNSHET